LAFTKWLTKPDHPLTSRVIVNRIRQHHFGTGIVATPDDFCSQDAIALCTALDGNYLPDTSGRIDGERIRWFNFDPPPCKPATNVLPPGRNPNRRSIYLQVRRVAAPGFLIAYDAPLMDNNVSLRFRSAVPQQALAALHNPLMLDAARALAERTKNDAGPDVVARIGRAIELTYSRPAAEKEVRFAFTEVGKQENLETGLMMFCQALLGSNDFLYLD
jgi:hypothetical protein